MEVNEETAPVFIAREAEWAPEPVLTPWRGNKCIVPSENSTPPPCSSTRNLLALQTDHVLYIYIFMSVMEYRNMKILNNNLLIIMINGHKLDKLIIKVLLCVSMLQ
jgi:hypothetical protein